MRILFACLTLLVVASSAAAQRSHAIDTALVDSRAAATTFCHVEGDSVKARTFIDVDEIQSAQLEVILEHERVHREDMRADSTLCAGRPRDVLRTEVHAYCVSDLVAVRLGAVPVLTYLGTLNALVRQFDETDVPYHDVVSAWFNACGAALGFPPATKRSPSG